MEYYIPNIKMITASIITITSSKRDNQIDGHGQIDAA